MKSTEIRDQFLKFFESRGHKIIPSASLVPKDDPSVLFNTAGMQPLVPYLLGKEHPEGRRLVDVQKCVRTQDILEIGDNTHVTFFEMMGNWSLGDQNAPDGIGEGYFKEEAIKWSYELLTSKEEGFGLDPSRLYITVFAGNDDAPKDGESAKIWQSLGVPENRIYYLEDNWWSPGDNGPCGPDSEMFYDVTEKGLGDLTHEEFLTADDKQQVVEIWNDVFMEYEKKEGKVIGKLKQKNVDTGAGLERIAMVLQKKDNIFDTDLFTPLISKIKELAKETPPADRTKAERILADHVRTSVFIIADGVTPSNTGEGYVLRRLLRRAIRFADILKIQPGAMKDLAQVVVNNYSEIYDNLQSEQIGQIIESEEKKFRNTLNEGIKKFTKLSENDNKISGEEAFILFSTYGFPLELTLELALEENISVDENGFWTEFKKHQEVSRRGAEQKFKGGLADDNEMTRKYHTATHLLHQALREVLGKEVQQKGSNITAERLRFDFTYPEKMTDEQKAQVEELVNKKIKEDLPVQNVTMNKDEALKTGALHFFGDKYGDTVSVYYIGDSIDSAFSKEFCGGPHVDHTGNLGKFKIKKEESVSAGTRRIKAILE